MSYLVLARKYRPQRFEEVVGQEHITRTLGNAITTGRLAHAILFAGPRGTGKTTVARILAKCVNCESGPASVPCNQCRSCLEITKNHASDVFEIDGASNNKVENVRELRENAKYRPAHSPYKIYIVDEVHMLSDAAFNALLKILEEPPAHVMFFFATTEPGKIPITILSRCQRHDFRRVAIDAMVDHMAALCGREGIEIDRDGLSLVAREADGSIRDALSLLDHIMACAAETIDTRAILDVLGSVDRRELFAISGAVLKGDTAGVLEIIDRCYGRGQPMMKLFTEILSHFRNLLVVQMGGGADALADIPAHEIEALQKQAADIPVTHLHQILDILFREEVTVKHSSQPKLALEMAFLRILQIQPALSMDTLIEKLDLLRQEVGPGGLKADGAGEHPGDKGPRGAEVPIPPPDVPEPSAPAGKAETKSVDPAAASEPPRTPESPEATAASTATAAAPARTAPGAPEDQWQCVLTRLMEQQPSLAACLAESRVKSISDRQIELELPPNQFYVNWVKRDKSQAALKQICCEQFGRDMEICLQNPPRTADNADKTDRKETERLKQEALNHPMVETAMKLFQGRIVDIKIL